MSPPTAAYYDDHVHKYQQERKQLEMSQVFEERTQPLGEGGEIIWYTEQDQNGDRIKIRETLVENEAVRADATLCVDSSTQPEVAGQDGGMVPKIKVISSPASRLAKEPPSRDQQLTSEQPQGLPPQPTTVQSKVHAKEIQVQRATQVQRETTETEQIVRNIHDVHTLQREHSAVARERKVFGSGKPGAAATATAPRFIRKLAPCAVSEHGEVRFQVEFSGAPRPVVTWYRENYEIHSSDDFKVNHFECFDLTTVLIVEHFSRSVSFLDNHHGDNVHTDHSRGLPGGQWHLHCQTGERWWPGKVFVQLDC